MTQQLVGCCRLVSLAACVVLVASVNIQKEDYRGLLDGVHNGQSFFDVSGYVHERVLQPRLPPIITTDTTFVARADQIALFDTSTGYQRGPISVAPHRTVTLHGVSVTGAVQQQSWPASEVQVQSTYHEWFPLFQLQESAALLLQDLTVHINPAAPLQAVCAQNGTMAALLSWLQYGGEIGSVPADISLQTEDIIAVGSAVLPQAVTGLCEGDVQPLAPANALIQLHNVTFLFADIALPAGRHLYLAQSVMGLYPQDEDDRLILQLQTNVTALLNTTAVVPYVWNRTSVADPEDNVIIYALPVHIQFYPFSSWTLINFSFHSYGGGIPQSNISYVHLGQQGFKDVPNIFDMLTPSSCQQLEGADYGTAAILMDSMQLVFDACYQPVWSRTQQALYKNNQVSIQTFLDGSGQLTFKNLTLLGASSRAHYEAYGPSVTLQLTNTVVTCLSTVAVVPPFLPPTLSILGVPADVNQVEDGEELLHLLTDPSLVPGAVILLDIGSSNIATGQAMFGSGFSAPMADGSMRAAFSSSGEGVWSLPPIPALEITSGNLTLANFTLRLPTSLGADTLFSDRTTWVTESQPPDVVPGLFGTILPPVFNVPGSGGASAANASLTLSNMTIIYDQCNSDLWSPAVAVVSSRNQAGLSIGFGDEQRLTCISCTFLGTDNTGNDSSDAQAMVKLLNTSIQCQNLTSSDEIYTHEAEAAQVKFCTGLEAVTLPDGQASTVAAELYGDAPSFFAEQTCNQTYAPVLPADFTNRSVTIVGSPPSVYWEYGNRVPIFSAGPGASIHLTRVNQLFDAYSFTATGQYLPDPQPYYVVATNGTGSLLPAPLFLSLLPSSFSSLTGDPDSPSTLHYEASSFYYAKCNAVVWASLLQTLQSLIPVAVTYTGNSSNLYCALDSGCNFLAVEPSGYVIDSLAQLPNAAAGFSALRSEFFTEQLLTAIPYAPDVPQQLNFRAEKPSVYVRLQDVNITCGSLITHSIPTGLPVPVTPQTQQVGVTSDADLVDAIIYAGIPIPVPLNIIVATTINQTQTYNTEAWSATIQNDRHVVMQAAVDAPAVLDFAPGQPSSMQVSPGGSLTIAAMVFSMQNPLNSSLPPDMKAPLNLVFYDQGLRVPAVFGALLPDWMGFTDVDAVDFSTPITAQLELQSMQLIYNTCSPVWTDIASILSTPAGGIYKLSDVATLTCDPYQGCQLSSTLGKIHYQLALINTTITCLHPAPAVDAVSYSRFHPPVGVLVALCVLSPLVSAFVTLWGVWALRAWALQPLKKTFHDEHEISKYTSPVWHAPKLEASKPLQRIPTELPGSMARSTTHSSDADGAQLLQRVRSLAVSRSAFSQQ